MYTITSVTSATTPLVEGQIVTGMELKALRDGFGNTFTVQEELQAGQYTIQPVTEWFGIKQPKGRWGILQAHHNSRTESLCMHQITIHDSLVEARQALIERLEADDRLYATLARDNWIFQNSKTIW